MKKLYVYTVSGLVALASSSPFAQGETNVTLFTNVNVFDGFNEKLIQNANEVVTGNVTTQVSKEPLSVAIGFRA